MIVSFLKPSPMFTDFNELLTQAEPLTFLPFLLGIPMSTSLLTLRKLGIH